MEGYSRQRQAQTRKDRAKANEAARVNEVANLANKMATGMATNMSTKKGEAKRAITYIRAGADIVILAFEKVVQLKATFAGDDAVGDIDSLNEALLELQRKFGKSELEVQGEAFAAWRQQNRLPNGCTPSGPRCIELSTDDLSDMDAVCNEVRNAVRNWRDSSDSKGMLP